MASHLRTTGCQTILLATQHERAHPALTPASKAGTTPEGWKAELT